MDWAPSSLTSSSTLHSENATVVGVGDQFHILDPPPRRKNWPMSFLSFGTVTGIIDKILRDANIKDQGNLPSVDDEVINALNALKRPCRELNILCQENIEHILCTLQLGAYAKPSPLRRLF